MLIQLFKQSGRLRVKGYDQYNFFSKKTISVNKQHSQLQICNHKYLPVYSVGTYTNISFENKHGKFPKQSVSPVYIFVKLAIKY